MPDVFTKTKRSAVMARIRSRGNLATEMRMIAIFRAHGITGWRRNRPVFGHPDFVFPKLRAALFVDGCFWHGCPCHYRAPATRRAFWRKKFERNTARDRLVTRTLRKAGWRVVRVWECALTGSGEGAAVSRIVRAINAKMNR